MNFFDFFTDFFENSSRNASFWGIICLLLNNIEIWPFLNFFSDFYRCAQFFMHIQMAYTDFIRKKIPKTL